MQMLPLKEFFLLIWFRVQAKSYTTGYTHQ
jgi:hypothetical protein